MTSGCRPARPATSATDATIAARETGGSPPTNNQYARIERTIANWTTSLRRARPAGTTADPDRDHHCHIRATDGGDMAGTRRQEVGFCITAHGRIVSSDDSRSKCPRIAGNRVAEAIRDLPAEGGKPAQDARTMLSYRDVLDFSPGSHTPALEVARIPG